MMALILTLFLWIDENCSRCGAELRKDVKFCTQCGLKVEPARCAKCKTVAEPKDKFCAHCGEPVGRPDDLDAGLERIRKGDLEAAIKHFTQCLMDNPHRPQYYAARGRAYAGLGQFDRAIEDANRAAALNNDDPWILEMRAEIRILSGQGDPFADLDRAIKLDPKRPSAWRVRSLACLKRGDETSFQQALQDADKAVEIDATSVSRLHRGRVRLEIAQIESSRGKDSTGTLLKALDDFQFALQQDSANFEARLARAETWIQIGRAQTANGRDAKDSYRQASDDLSEAIRQSPKLAKAYVLRAVVHREQLRPNEALQDCSRAIEFEPGYATAWRERGKCKSVLGDIAGAIEDFQNAVRLNPRDAESYVELGYARVLTADVAKAREEFTRAIELQPRHVRAWIGRGSARMSQGDFDGAIEDLGKAIQLDPRMPEAWSNRGLARMRAGDKKGAAEDFREALKVAPPSWTHRRNVEKLLEETSK